MECNMVPDKVCVITSPFTSEQQITDNSQSFMDSKCYTWVNDLGK